MGRSRSLPVVPRPVPRARRRAVRLAATVLLAAFALSATRLHEPARVRVQAGSLNNAYVQSVYQKLLGRAPDPAGLGYWVGALDSGVHRAAVASALVNSNEYRGDVIAGMYQQFLNRSVDSGGLNFWVRQVAAGMTFESFASLLIASPEYYAMAAKGNGDDTTFVQSMYQDILGRAVDIGGRDYFVAQLHAGVPRSAVVAAVVLSTEHLTTTVDSYYVKFLGRHLDPSGQSYWVHQLQMGARDETIIALIIGSDEYYVVATAASQSPPATGSCTASASSTAAKTASSSQPALTPDQAAAEASSSVATASGHNLDGTVTLATAVNDHGHLSISTSTVANPAEAAQRAASAASQAKIVAVDVASPVHADVTAATTPATDPMRSSQWPLTDTTFEQVWPRSTGGGITVAVVDTGVDATHPDLAGQVLPGWEYLNDTVNGQAGGQVDPFGHGTHVAGTIAALADNGMGVAGAAPGTKILPVRVLDANGSGWDTDVARGITWAADHGAKVVNLSLGGPSDSAVMQSAITYANTHDVLVVAAAGNTYASGNQTSYPGADAHVVAVAALDQSNAHAGFSTSGSYVAIAAPGVLVLSTLSGGGYGYMSGTSMATPHVAAAAALVYATHASDTADQVRAALVESATELGAPGTDPLYGAGLVDPAKAVDC